MEVQDVTDRCEAEAGRKWWRRKKNTKKKKKNYNNQFSLPSSQEPQI